jgi:hypothetical protein
MEMILPRKLLHEIFVTTSKIQKEYPELYENLRETPLFLDDNRDEITAVDFEQYLESLQTQLAVFRKTSVVMLTSLKQVQ